MLRILPLKTVLSDYNGDFSISANPGDVIRFTSIITERKDIKLTPQMMDQKNLVELKVAYHDIQEVVISRLSLPEIYGMMLIL
jgi:hypothetical protein